MLKQTSCFECLAWNNHAAIHVDAVVCCAIEEREEMYIICGGVRSSNTQDNKENKNNDNYRRKKMRKYRIGS